MNVEEIMNSDFVTISQDDIVRDAAELMFENNVSILPVVDDEKNVVGVLTVSDFMGKEVRVPHALATIKEMFGEFYGTGAFEKISKTASQKPISDVMAKTVKTVNKNEPLSDLVEYMITNHLKRMPVVDDDDRIVGVVTRRDIIKSFLLH